MDDAVNPTPPPTDAGESKQTTQATGLLVDAALRCRHAVRCTLRAGAAEEGAAAAAAGMSGVEGTVELLRLRIDAAQGILAVHGDEVASAALHRLEQMTEVADTLCSLAGPSAKQGRLDEHVRAQLFSACDGVRDTLRRVGVRVEDDVSTNHAPSMDRALSDSH